MDMDEAEARRLMAELQMPSDAAWRHVSQCCPEAGQVEWQLTFPVSGGLERLSGSWELELEGRSARSWGAYRVELFGRESQAPALSEGEVTRLPPEVLEKLLHRHRLAVASGADWLEDHYRPGKRL